MSTGGVPHYVSEIFFVLTLVWATNLILTLVVQLYAFYQLSKEYRGPKLYIATHLWQRRYLTKRGLSGRILHRRITRLLLFWVAVGVVMGILRFLLGVPW